MPSVDARQLPGELQRLAECMQEPIRTPGAVQPHGALIAAERGTWRIVHASENTDTILGVEALTLLGRPLTDLVGPEAAESFSEVLDESTASANPVRLTFRNHPVDVILHALGDLVLVEFEPVQLTAEGSTPAVFGAIHRLTRATTVQELWDGTAIEMRRLTGFDRVMVYHFHPDAHGEVVAEQRADDMQPYLGLHYPASDIPAQARDLYLSKLSRVIANSDVEGSPLLTLADAPGGSTLDLSGAELRSVSPHHLQFMRNMGQASTMSFSLIQGDALIGMITCAHRTPRRTPFILRQGLEILANQVALQLGSMVEIERLTRMGKVRDIRTRLVARLDVVEDFVPALLHGPVTLLDLLPADGALLRLGETASSVGVVPPIDVLNGIAARILELSGTPTLVSDSLALDYPELATLLPAVAGLLIVPLGGDGDYLAWFRHEVGQTVRWLGDQSPANRLTTLSPRNTFAEWRQAVSGTAISWDGLDAEATELARDLEGVLLRRTESQLAELALHDALTGLPNRRMLMDRLDHALELYARGGEVSLLFIDLDSFKGVNDTWGHAAGDAVITHAARQIAAVSRAQDTVARIGGDEFVVLCENTTA
ncbi:MAG: hypothetical protein JWO10_1482, partial [Microbacteriaceae bacterium]|nr:hypothetical protein [Microbacteriaceae bacterium]